MFAAAANAVKSNDDTKAIAYQLEGMKFATFDGGEGYMRKDDHQFIQDLFIASFGPQGANDKFDEEKTGWGWKQIAKVDKENTLVPTICKMQRP